jgi:MFS family permease
MFLAPQGDDASPQAVPARRLFGAQAMVTALLCVLFAIMYLDRVNIAAAAAPLKAHFALSNAETGLIFSGFSWAYLGSVIFGGWGARKFGAKSTLAVCVVIVGVGTIATGLAGGLATLFIARLLVGMGEGPAFPAATQAMRNWYPPHRFGYIQGITHSASRLGAALAPPIVTAVILWSGWRFAFMVCGVAALAWCAIWWATFRDDPREHPTFDRSALQDLTVSLPDRRAKIPLLLLTKRMSSVTLVMFAYGWTYWVFVSWLPLYFVNQHHTDLRSSALLTSALFFTGLVGNTVGGIISDRVLKATGRNRLARCSVIFVSLLGAATLITPTMFHNDLRIVVPLLAGAMFFLELTIAPMYAIPMDVSKEYAGLGSAYVIMGVGLAGIVSPVVFGWLIDLTGNWNVPFATGVAILLVGAAAVPLLRPDLPLLIPSDPSADNDDLHQLAAGSSQLR